MRSGSLLFMPLPSGFSQERVSMKTPTTLIIMDGFGLGPKYPGNAVENTPKPHLENIFKECPGCRLSASGLDVGLPEGQMGNSEVGHTNIGAGRVVFQDLPHISRDIDSGEFFKNPAYLEAMEHCREWGTALHLMGLLSDGGVHSHITHLFALVKMAKEQGLEKVYVHCFLDGRDVPPSSGKSYVEQLQAKLDELGTGRIATVMGRYYAMDRDKRWDRVQRAYDAIALGEGIFEENPAAAVQKSYDSGVTDEGLRPGGFCLYHRVRRYHAQCDGGLPPAEAGEHLRRVYQQAGADPAAHR